MKLLIDTNIILDVLLKRQPFCDDAAKVLGLVSRKDVEEYISAAAVTDIHYIAYRALRDKATVRALLEKLLTIVSVAGVSEREIRNALRLNWNDFEDSVQYSTALLNGLDGIVTRNLSDYADSEIPVWKPEELLKQFE